MLLLGVCLAFGQPFAYVVAVYAMAAYVVALQALRVRALPAPPGQGGVVTHGRAPAAPAPPRCRGSPTRSSRSAR
jgi:hypothetical protein